MHKDGMDYCSKCQHTVFTSVQPVNISDFSVFKKKTKKNTCFESK